MPLYLTGYCAVCCVHSNMAGNTTPGNVASLIITSKLYNVLNMGY